MLAKVFIFSCFALAALSTEREPWEWAVELVTDLASGYVNITGVSGNDYEQIPPLDDCANIDSQVCHNFRDLRQNAINGQINMELRASYVYMAMGAYFSRDDPNLMGFAKFFYEASVEEREHALKLIEYQNMRGGKVKLTTIQAPTSFEWDNGLAALEEALQLEKTVNAALLRLHKAAEDDAQMQDFLEANYLDEQVKSIRQLGGFISQLKKMTKKDPGLGEHIFDGELHK